MQVFASPGEGQYLREIIAFTEDLSDYLGRECVDFCHWRCLEY